MRLALIVKAVTEGRMGLEKPLALEIRKYKEAKCRQWKGRVPG